MGISCSDIRRGIKQRLSSPRGVRISVCLGPKSINHHPSIRRNQPGMQVSVSSTDLSAKLQSCSS
eukprot:6755002-Karenia_brevis.AAC.1